MSPGADGLFPLPPHAYLPGQTPRHPETAFDAVKRAVPPRTISDEAAKNLAWRHGLRLFAEGFFWEAHEVLEPVWMNAAPNSAERAVVQGVIQLANAALKTRMGRQKAAERLAGLADGLFAQATGVQSVMGLPVAGLRQTAQAAARTTWQAQASAMARLARDLR